MRHILYRVLIVVVTASAAGCDPVDDAPVELPIPVAPAADEQSDDEFLQLATTTASARIDAPGPAEEPLFDLDEDDELPPGIEPRPDWHALLVGCTEYRSLDSASQLRGPANDVRLMRHLLTHRFGVLPDNVTVLAEGYGIDARPTKANIQRELERLASDTPEGDSVVILLSGHGSQQPDDDPDNPLDLEPDGLDEVFLPANIRIPEDPYAISIPNGLSDDELRASITRIRNKGVFVWAIVDACHSGSAIRGGGVYRQVAPETFFSRDVLQTARDRAVSTRGAHADPALAEAVDGAGEFVAIYAAQPREPTIELPLPADDPDAHWSGLLTYTLARVLTESPGAMTYRELVERVHAEYVQSMGRLGPTPLIEGTGQGQTVFGGAATDVPEEILVLGKVPDGWIVNAGRLHGLTKGSVLAVHPPPGADSRELVLGHVRVVKARLVESRVESIEYGDTPQAGALPIGSVCSPVHIEQGGFALRVAIESEGESEALQGSIVEALQRCQSDARVSLEVVPDSARADWIIRIGSDNQPMLVPAAGWTWQPEENSIAFAPASETDGSDLWLCQSLERIARVAGLLKVCQMQNAPRNRGWLDALAANAGCHIDVELVRLDEEAGEQPLEWTAEGLRLDDGDVVALHVTNTGSFDVDFSVLFIDSRFGISLLFPQPGLVADNRIPPGQTLTVGPLQVDATTLGLEHLVVIASRGEGQPLDWNWLSQPSLEASTNRSAGTTESLQTPVGELLQQAMFASGATRGMQVVKADDVALRVITWTTQSGESE